MFISLTIHAQHLGNALQTQKRQKKRFRRTVKSAEHGLDTFVAKVCDSVYHLFMFVFWISDFCYCSTCADSDRCTRESVVSVTARVPQNPGTGGYLTLISGGYLIIITMCGLL